MKDSTVCTHLAKRGNRYSLRRKIPTDLQEHYGGRIEIVKALGTSDRREAERLCRVAGAALDEEFQKVRDDIAQDKATAATPTPTPRINADEVASRTLAALRHRRDSAARLGYAELEAFMERQRVSLADQEAILRGDMEADHPLSKHEGWRNAIRTFLTGDGIVKELPVAPPKDSPAPATTHAGEQDSLSSDTLTGVLDKWVLERQPEKRTIAKAVLAVKRFTESQGKLLVSRYTARHIVAFKDKLLADGQTPINTNKQLEQLSILFNYARKNLLIPSNPAEGIRVQVSKRAKEARLPFEEEHLRQFFAGPVHAKGDRPAPGAGEAAYWLPLLSLYSGARVEELAQLGPNDVYQESYTDSDGTARTAWVIAVTDEGDGQAVKNAGSRRRFPVHQDLIRLGFIDFIEPIKATGRTRVFDKLIPDVMGAESGNWAKWFSKYLRGVIGITDKRRVFHSFRHTFKAISRACEIPEDIHDAITGHSSASVARSYGGTDYPLRPLVEAMKRYKPPSLGLPIKPSI